MDTITVSIKEKAGSFAENKDVARELRIKHIIPALKKNKTVVIDFSDVTGATQSFTNGLQFLKRSLSKTSSPNLRMVSLINACMKDCVAPVTSEKSITTVLFFFNAGIICLILNSLATSLFSAKDPAFSFIETVIVSIH